MAFLLVLVAVLLAAPAHAQQKPKPAPAAPAAAGPVIVLETAKGTIEIQTYPQEAPTTVAYITALIKKNFYNGQRFHRVEPFVIQIGDPQTRDMTKQASWGPGNSGTPVGVAEMSKKLLHTAGAVGMAHGGDAKSASGQFYIIRRAAPTLNGKYVVFGKVIKGMDVAAKIQKADVLKRASVRE